MPKEPKNLPAIREHIRNIGDMKARGRLQRGLKAFDLEQVKGQRDIAARFAFLTDVMTEIGVDNPEVRNWCNDTAKLLNSFTVAYAKFITIELPVQLKEDIERLEASFELLKEIMRDEVDKDTYETIMRRFDIERPL